MEFFENNVKKINAILKKQYPLYFGRKEVKTISAQIQRDENVITAIVGQIGETDGTVVLTDKRFLYATNAIYEKNIETISFFLKDVTEISEGTATSFFKSIRISGHNFSCVINGKIREIKNFKLELEKQVYNYKK